MMLTVLALCALLQQEPLLEEAPLEQEEPLEQDPVMPPIQEEDPDRIGEPLTRPTAWNWSWFPDTVIFRNYLADPISPRSGTKITYPVDSSRGNVKLEGSVGSQRTFARMTSRSGREQIDFGVEGAVISRFDLSEDWDLDSGDYRWGFPVGYRYDRVSARFHLWHLSSHLGDEYISRTGEKAIRYHKNELAVGIAYDLAPDVRAYWDVGYGVYIGTPNERWRGQTGLEWVGDLLGPGLPRTYVALDFKWREETDWDTAVSIQAGLWLVQEKSASAAGLRVLFEYYRGKTAQTQFPDEPDHHWGLGFAAGF